VTVEKVDLYKLGPDDIVKYLPGKDCEACGFCNCYEFAVVIGKKEVEITDCPHLAVRMTNVLEGVLSIDLEMDEGDSMMETVNQPIIELNSPDRDSPVLVTGNSEITIFVMKRIFSRTDVSAFLLPSDTKGFTIDHAAGLRLFTPQSVMRAIMVSGIASKVDHRTLMIPGLCDGTEKSIQNMTRWSVKVGPNSGFELPSFILERLGEDR
jgi:CO dehydrogenase/acetyl-CoA synthase gamma subunit (corrinoid Fe-S protein)